MKFYNALRYRYVIGLHRDENQTKNFVLCEIIFSTESKFLPENLTTDSVLHGATNVSTKLNQFCQYWICGPDSRRWKSGTKQCRIQSVSQDVTFAASSGRKLPSKHLKLGVALKSLTDSRKFVEIFSRYGHCANYYTVEEIEAELTFNATETQMEIPNGIGGIGCIGCKGGIGCAFENFDRFAESQSGKVTLHDPLGISYELVFPS